MTKRMMKAIKIVSRILLDIGRVLGDAVDIRAQAAQAFVQFFVTAIDLVNIVDFRRPAGDQGSDDQGDAGADVRADEPFAEETSRAAYDDAMRITLGEYWRPFARAYPSRGGVGHK